MPFEKGNAFGKGRPIGSKNALTKQVKQELLTYLSESVPDMIECVEGMKVQDRFRAYMEIAKLVLPKEKAIDLTVETGLLREPIIINMTKESSDEDLRTLN
ncbi:hypothetical protein QWY87_13635 [Lutimonas halocynthiae]|uniref:hypothetical protein n=1 Tax=Lutimonas halocynthiae TaxID=1446477 RepID=UPI0025B607A0|nr:hypothetical protein [Lutimonas halocynthiae]MDN3643753.1 hypothetical protein [Lutimonas halocynthiae]